MSSTLGSTAGQLEADVFAKYPLPAKPGNQLSFNHLGCAAGTDLKNRLYIKYTGDGKMYVAWCHHCGRKRAKPVSSTISSPCTTGPISPPGMMAVEVQRSIIKKHHSSLDPTLAPFAEFFSVRMVDRIMLVAWELNGIFPRWIRCTNNGEVHFSMRRNIICKDDIMIRGYDVGEQSRHVYPGSGPKYWTSWFLPGQVRDQVEMTPCVIHPICMPKIIRPHTLVFTEDLITALRFAYAGVNALPCGGANNLTDNLLWRTAQDYPAITGVAFAFDNDGTAITRIQEKAFVTAELLFSNVIYDPQYRYDRMRAGIALDKWGWA